MKTKNIGGSFDDFLREEAMLDEATAVAVKRVIAWQIDQEMKSQKLTKSSMAKKMHTSRAALNRLLDATDTSLTLTTLSSAASVLEKNCGLNLRLRKFNKMCFEFVSRISRVSQVGCWPSPELREDVRECCNARPDPEV